jgi:transcriptional regulator with XRE-family HTH domain
MKEVSDLLRDYQYDNKLTQHDMAKFLGVAQSTYNNWVNGQSAVNPVKYYEKIAKLCGVDVHSILPVIHKLEDMNHDTKGLVYCEKYVKSLEDMIELLKNENRNLLGILREKEESLLQQKASL